MNDDDIVRDFLVESYENLDQLDRDLVGLEKNPHDRDAMSAVFRTIHTIKGTCGFLGFSNLEKVAHVGENLLVLLRDARLVLNPEITTALLSMVDAVRQMLKSIELTGKDGDSDYPELRERLTRLQRSESSTDTIAATAEQSIKTEDASRKPVSASGVAQGVAHHVVQDDARRSAEGESKAAAVTAAANASEQPDAQRPQAQGPVTQASASESTVRVQVRLLDKVMTLVGELVLARNQMLQYSGRVKDPGLQAATQRLNLITTELQEGVMKTRMQPIGNIWAQFPRTVRDVAFSCGKQVEIEMEGKDTELDKTIIEAIKDPLTHLVRNSVDHGIELPEERVKQGKHPAGRLTLRAFHEGGQVNIAISDDGAGLHEERIRKKAIERGIVSAEQAERMSQHEIFKLIFSPGFSTAEKVTNVSGRGVGMDVVKTNVERIGGTVDIQSTRGAGTTVRVKIPLTLAIIPALVITCGGDRYAIPQISLLELVRLEADKVANGIELVHGAPVYRLRGRLLPLVCLEDELQIGDSRAQTAASGAVNIVVLQAGDRQFGLVVDQINDSEEIVVKPLRKQLKSVRIFAGSSIMGDGRIALILDVLGLAQRASVITEGPKRPQVEKAPGTLNAAAEKHTFLLFSGRGDSRMAIPLNTLARLEEFPAEQVEMSGHRWVTQYRGQILPLIRLNLVLEERRARLKALQAAPPQSEAGPLQVLVLNQEGKSFGLVVEKILDIVEDRAQVRMAATRPYVLHTVVIGDRVTELLDVPAILRTADMDASIAARTETAVAGN